MLIPLIRFAFGKVRNPSIPVPYPPAAQTAPYTELEFMARVQELKQQISKQLEGFTDGSVEVAPSAKWSGA